LRGVLRWVTHGPSGDIMDLYTTLPWPTLCEAVACLKIERRRGEVVELRQAARVDGRGAKLGTVLGTDAPRQRANKKKAPRFVTLGLPFLRGGRDSKALGTVSPGERSRALVSEDEAFGLCAVPDDEPTCTLVSEGCTNVPSAVAATGRDDALATDLAKAQRDWEQARDRRALERSLLDVVRRLAEEE
jgi:hypothetical protein